MNGFNLSYHTKETVLFTIDPYYGILNYISLTRTRFKGLEKDFDETLQPGALKHTEIQTLTPSHRCLLSRPD